MAASEAKRWAVLIGIDFYEEPDDVKYADRRPTNLSGCVADVTEVEQVLRTQYGVPPERIFKLTAPVPTHPRVWSFVGQMLSSYWYGSKKESGRMLMSRIPGSANKPSPTYQNIIDAFKNVIENAHADDFVYIHYSGHGRRVTSIFQNLKVDFTDQPDEALVPTDIGPSKGRYLRDVELHYLLQKMVQKKLKVFIVLDCCHSGGATRMFQLKIRDLGELDRTVYEADVSLLPSDELTSTWPSSQGMKGYTCLAACGKHDPAYEKRYQNGKVHGALTYSFIY